MRELSDSLVRARFLEIYAANPAEDQPHQPCRAAASFGGEWSEKIGSGRQENGCLAAQARAPMPPIMNSPTPPSHMLLRPKPKSRSGRMKRSNTTDRTSVAVAGGFFSGSVVPELPLRGSPARARIAPCLLCPGMPPPGVGDPAELPGLPSPEAALGAPEAAREIIAWRVKSPPRRTARRATGAATRPESAAGVCRGATTVRRRSGAAESITKKSQCALYLCQKYIL